MQHWYQRIMWFFTFDFLYLDKYSYFTHVHGIFAPNFTQLVQPGPWGPKLLALADIAF